MTACATTPDIGAIRAVLATVDCQTRDFARLGYSSLTAAHSPFQLALTAILTIYVTILGYRLMFGGDLRLSDSPGIALKIGAVLALVTNWGVFQTLIFDLASQAPVEIAAVISAPVQNRSDLAKDPVDGLQAAYDQLTAAAGSLAKSATPGESSNAATPSVGESDASGAANAGEALNAAANAVFLSSAGLVSIATVAIGVLTAAGPLFVALFLFLETRGLFAGWVRALGTAAFALLSTWTLAVLMLDALEPWLAQLSQQPASGRPDTQTAMTAASIVYIFAASQVGMVLLGAIVALGFRLSQRIGEASATDRTGVRQPDSPAAHMPLSRPARLAEVLYQSPASSVAAGRLADAASPVSIHRTAAAMLLASDSPRQSDWYRRPTISRTESRRVFS
jgi:type IV secretion system protein VirB6